MTRNLLPILLLAAFCQVAEGSVFQERVDVEWVLVPATVRKGASHVRGLEARDFELTVDGRPVPIGSFEARVDAPVSLIHLQDLSGSMALGGRLETSRRVLSCFLERARPGDAFALASFAGGNVGVEVPFTADVSVLGEAMSGWRGYGTTALHDAVAWLPDVAVGDRGARRAAVLITDGADNASVLSPTSARELVRRAQFPVYVLGLQTGSPPELDPGGRKLHRHAGVLNLLAHLTGGRYHPIVARDSRNPRASAGLPERVCAVIDEELRSQYVLGFAASAAGSINDRSIRVTVPGRKVEVRHRHGYSGRPPALELGSRTR